MTEPAPPPRHFDPGCPHEAAHRALLAALADPARAARLVGVSGSGCGSRVSGYLPIAWVAAPFGRAVSVARGLRLARPDLVPLVYAGDGELLGEGAADLLRAVEAGAPLAVIMVDNLGPACPSEAGTPGLPGAPRGAPPAWLGRLLPGATARDAVRPEAVARSVERALTQAEQGRLGLAWIRGACPAAEGSRWV